MEHLFSSLKYKGILVLGILHLRQHLHHCTKNWGLVVNSLRYRGVFVDNLCQRESGRGQFLFFACIYSPTPVLCVTFYYHYGVVGKYHQNVVSTHLTLFLFRYFSCCQFLSYLSVPHRHVWGAHKCEDKLTVPIIVCFVCSMNMTR